MHPFNITSYMSENPLTEGIPHRFFNFANRNNYFNPTPTQSLSTSTGYTTTYTNSLATEYALEEKIIYVTESFMSEGVETSHYETSCCTEEVTFQDTEFSFLNSLSETPNPSHTVDYYTWVSEQATTTCERETGATWLGHADYTLAGEVTAASTTWTPTARISATLSSRKGGKNEDEESAVLIEPRLRSAAAFWVFFIWLGFV